MDQKIEPTVYVVDDDEAVRESLRALFQSVHIPVAAFASAKEFLDAVEGPGIGCLIVDLRMPGLSGLELQDRLAERQIHLPVIMITGHGDVTSAVRAMKAGAKDFIEKPFNEQLLLERVRACLEESAREKQIVNGFQAIKTRFNRLTQREQEILALVAQGTSSKIIARQLGISPKTVDVHRSRLMVKLGVKSLSELIRLAVQLEQHSTH